MALRPLALVVALVGACAWSEGPPSTWDEIATPNDEVRTVPDASPQVRPVPAAAGDSVAMVRTRCFGTCPQYDVTLWANGRVEYIGRRHVTQRRTIVSAIDPEVAADLVRAAGELDAVAIPSERRRCATDGAALQLTIRRRGAEARTLWVESTCVMSWCENESDCRPVALPVELTRRGFTRAAMAAMWDLGDEIDRRVPTTVWVDDPACRDLPTQRFAPDEFAPTTTDVGDLPERLRNERYAAVISALAHDSQRRVSITALDREGIATVVRRLRADLLARDVAQERIVEQLVGFDDIASVAMAADPDAIALRVGPPQCF